MLPSTTGGFFRIAAQTLCRLESQADPSFLTDPALESRSIRRELSHQLRSRIRANAQFSGLVYQSCISIEQQFLRYFDNQLEVDQKTK